MAERALEFDYRRAASTGRLIRRVLDCAESISLGFDGYGREEFKRPGLYVAVVAGRSVAGFADPMGTNLWPVDTCGDALADLDRFYEAASTVATSRDGGAVVGVDGTVLEQMVRFRDVTGGGLEGASPNDLEYADWMGARHMSAHETSLRPEVVATVTLSEESGRVTVFRDGEYETTVRERLGEPWRADE